VKGIAPFTRRDPGLRRGDELEFELIAGRVPVEVKKELDR
jgi:hypothetical protein